MATALFGANGDPESRHDRAIAVFTERAPTMAMALTAEAAAVGIA